jgi:hypothetical protein
LAVVGRVGASVGLHVVLTIVGPTVGAIVVAVGM